jgi:hypothetical protein
MSNRESVATLCFEHPTATDSAETDFKSRAFRRILKLLSAPGLWLFGGSSLFCWLCLFRLSGTPIWTGGDQTMWLADGQRMFFGEVLYRDFFQMTFPGTELLYLAAFKFFGLRTWIPDALLVITGATLASLIYSISRSVLPARYSWLPPLS